MINIVKFSVFYLSLVTASNSQAEIKTFNSSFGMEFMIDGDHQNSLDRWTLICTSPRPSTDCVLQIVSIHCDKDYFASNNQLYTTQMNTLQVVGRWLLKGVLTTKHKDGLENWTCQFSVGEKGDVSDANCKADAKGKFLETRMLPHDIKLSQTCPEVKFRGRNQ